MSLKIKIIIKVKIPIKTNFFKIFKVLLQKQMKLKKKIKVFKNNNSNNKQSLKPYNKI